MIQEHQETNGALPTAYLEEDRESLTVERDGLAK